MKLFIKFLFISLIYVGEIPLLRSEIKPENQIMSNAMSVYNTISEEEDIKSRINKKEFVLNKIDEIKTKYSATDIGITILSTDLFGDINIKKLRESYLKDLTTFSLKTCESSPSTTCLAFISLDSGNKACENTNSFNQYIKASNNFKNAYRVFKKEKKDNKYNLAVISSYTRCADLTKSEFGKDFINSRFINVLLEKGDLSRAKGLTQNMTTPIFKILSATDIRIKEGKFDIETFNLLINKNSKSSINDSFYITDDFEKSIVTLSLINKLLTSGGDPFVKDSILYKRSTNMNTPFLSTDNGMSSCSEGLRDRAIYVNDIAMDTVFLLKELEMKKKKIGTTLDDLYNRGRYAFTPFISSHTTVCGNYKTYNLDIIEKLLSRDLIVLAKKLRSFQKDINIMQLSYEEAANLQADFLLQFASQNELISLYKNRGDTYGDYEKMLEENKVFDEKHLKKTGKLKFNRFLYPFVTNKANYKIFKLLVDNGDICLASKKLFREIRGTEFESDAVLYLIKNEEFMESNNSCGDSDLDLLIN